MKPINRCLVCIALLLGVVTLIPSNAVACDRTDFTLNSISFNPADSTFTITATMCIGGGLAGSTQGADNNTPVFGIGFWGSPGLSIISYSPDFNTGPPLTGDTTGCPMANFTNAGGAFGTQEIIVYQGQGCNFQCITSTAQCGRPHEQCIPMVYTVTEIPDSIVGLGVEGSGNIGQGCARPGEIDMVIDLHDTILPVEWATIHAMQVEEAIQVDWGTHMEVNNDHFEVMKSDANGDWSVLGSVAAAGFSDVRQSYSYLDQAPRQGQNQYKIVQVDFDGRSSESEVVSVQFDLQTGLVWKAVGPNPVRDILNLSFLSEMNESMQLQMFDMRGKKVFQKDIQGTYGLNTMNLDLSSFGEGAYFIRINGSQGRLDKKIIKL